MSNSDKGWFPPGYRSILELVDEIGREIQGAGYWPDNSPRELIPPRIGGTLGRSSLLVHRAADGLWWERCEQHRRPARDRLRTKLAAGEIGAFVLCGVHGLVPIEPKWWWSDETAKALRTGKAELLLRLVPAGERMVPVIASGPVGVRVPAQQETARARAEPECRRWLAGAIRTGRYPAKKQYLEAARATIPGLSAAAFGRAWQELAREPGNGWMVKAGRRKSARPID